ncbi:MAG: dihydrodipicolinate synthase family protein [Actinomycetota bacterium]|nr:dihydrodipicolinate synthase family protein [Actinomycetota bacterium]
MGGQGVISVASHLMGKQIKKMIGAFKNSDIQQAQDINNSLMDFFKVIFITTNPVPIKEALNLAGLNVGKTRLPLWRMEDNKKEKLIDILKKYSIIE